MNKPYEVSAIDPELSEPTALQQNRCIPQLRLLCSAGVAMLGKKYKIYIYV